MRLLNRRAMPLVIRRGTVVFGVSGVKVEGLMINHLESARETMMGQETFKPSFTANIGKGDVEGVKGEVCAVTRFQSSRFLTK